MSNNPKNHETKPSAGVTPVKARCVERYQVHKFDEAIRFFVGGFEIEIDHYETWIDPRKNEVVFRLRIPE